MAFSLSHFLSIILLLVFCLYEGTAYDLIHRDSPLSPFYNPSNTHYDRLRNAFQRSINRANQLNSKAPLNPSGGEYLLKMFLGTPPVEILGIVDTGSDLTWTQCLPCIKCFNQSIPLFNPTHSTSYKNISCKSTFCNALLDKSFCDDQTLACKYNNYKYGGGAYTSGDLASETLKLGNGTESVSISNFAFGCGHNNEVTFNKTESGIIGLSTSELSLVSQLGSSVGKKFSYCLAPASINTTSEISFGNTVVLDDSGIVVTPFQPPRMAAGDSRYHLTLEAISVGDKRINLFTSPSEGNIIIDSGTTLTLVPNHVFKELDSALDKVIKLQRVVDPGAQLNICYKSSDRGEVNFPLITMHFKGADVVLKPVNTFSWVKDDVVCFTMIPTDGLSIYGNLAQTNFEIGYDLEARFVSFRPTDCAN